MTAGGSIAASASQGIHSPVQCLACSKIDPDSARYCAGSPVSRRWSRLVRALGSDEKPGETPVLTNPKPRINVIRDDASAIRWKIDKQRVDGMVEAGLLQATGSENPTAGWLSLVSPEDTVGIKVNAGPGQISGTRREVTDTVVRGLLKAGIPSKQIIIWDAKLEDLHKAKFDTLAKRHGVRLSGSMDAGWDESVVMDKAILGTLIEGDVGFDPDEERTAANLTSPG